MKYQLERVSCLIVKVDQVSGLNNENHQTLPHAYRSGTKMVFYKKNNF